MTSAHSFDVEHLRKRYERAWELVLHEHNERELLARRKPVSQDSLAAEFKVSSSTVSRALSGKAVPMAQGLLVEIAEYLEVSDARTRVLLAWARALNAADAEPPGKNAKVDERKVASYYSRMFFPLYEEGKLASRMISPQSSAYHALLKLGVEADVAARCAPEFRDCQSTREAIMKVMFSDEIIESIPAEKLGTLPKLEKLFSHVGVVDLFGPCAQLPAKLLQRAEKRGECVARAWTASPNLTVTRLEVLSHTPIRDGRHGGLELLFLLEGSGTFELKGVGSIELKKGYREMITYRAIAPHTFRADTLPTVLCVINYDKPDDDLDPTADLFDS